MPTRREFHRLATVTAAAPALAVRASPAKQAALDVRESDTEITVDNGEISLVVSKVNNARLTSLRLRGQELLGNGGRGNYDVNTEAIGPPGPLPPASNGYAVRRGDDFVDIAFTVGPTAAGPFTTVRHHIVRAGEPGVHLASEFHHSPDVHGFKAVQHRYVLWLDPQIFTHASVEEDPIGLPWRGDATPLPTPAELVAAPEVMDATEDLAGLGSVYPRRYYTKYDWAVYQKDHVVHGLLGGGYGVWAVLAEKEAFCGGPTRQDLTVHQTTTQPVVLVEPQATHYGSPAVEVTGAWSKTYGPYYLHLNTGTDPAAMRADALRFADPAYHREFYDRVALPGRVPTEQRSTVDGRIRIPGRHDLTGAVAVLSDDRVDFQSTVLGHQYWADADGAGNFRLTGVRPGGYRLTVYRPGTWGEFVRDAVVVEPGTMRLPDVVWRPTRNGRTLWQIGRPDRTSVEFRRGAEFRRYGLFEHFPADFGDGVVWTVGRSGPDDFNYVQYQRVNGVPAAPWRIHFELDRIPRPGATATLTVALAAWAMDTARPVPPEPSNLTITVNDTGTLVWTFAMDDARGATYRSSCAGFNLRREFRFDAAMLRPGGNDITLQINQGTPEHLGNQAAYDAIRLEVDG